MCFGSCFCPKPETFVGDRGHLIPRMISGSLNTQPQEATISRIDTARVFRVVTVRIPCGILCLTSRKMVKFGQELA